MGILKGGECSIFNLFLIYIAEKKMTELSLNLNSLPLEIITQDVKVKQSGVNVPVIRVNY